jgi:hypothetical protein
MFSLTRSLPINRPDDKASVTRAQVWEALTRKARDGRAFVPGMTSCRVLEEHDKDNFVRELSVGDGAPFRERVSLVNEKLVVFAHVGGPQTSVVLNQLETDASGALCLRYTFLIEQDGVAPGSAEEKEMMRQLSQLPMALDATLDAIHAMAARGDL